MSGYSLVKEFNAIKSEEFPWTSEVTKWAPQKSIQKPCLDTFRHVEAGPCLQANRDGGPERQGHDEAPLPREEDRGSMLGGDPPATLVQDRVGRRGTFPGGSILSVDEDMFGMWSYSRGDLARCSVVGVSCLRGGARPGRERLDQPEAIEHCRPGKALGDIKRLWRGGKSSVGGLCPGRRGPGEAGTGRGLLTEIHAHRGVDPGPS